MKCTSKHPVYGEIIYTENFWTGKKRISFNGVDAQPVSKKEFMIDSKKAIIKGSYLTGVSLGIEGETIQLSSKTKWYEGFLAFLPLLFLMIWGNSTSLCAIFPVVGGAIGGALGGIAMVTSLLFMKKQKSAFVKIIIGIIIFAITVFIAYIVAYAMLQLIA